VLLGSGGDGGNGEQEKSYIARRGLSKRRSFALLDCVAGAATAQTASAASTIQIETPDERAIKALKEAADYALSLPEDVANTPPW
jgi:hypothetical protein